MAHRLHAAAENDLHRPRRASRRRSAREKDSSRAEMADAHREASRTRRIGHMIKRLLTLMTILATTSCGAPSSTPAAAPAAHAPADRKYLLERVDDAAVVQLYADGFADLPVKEKTLIWHLYQAAIAGRDIFYDQRYAHGLEMRDVLEAIVSHKTAVEATTFNE